MNTQLKSITVEKLATISGGSTNWENVVKGTTIGAGIGVSVCTAAGLFTAGTSWWLTGACAWPGAKLTGALTVIADNIIK